MIVPRLKETKRAELEAFWRSHLEAWQSSDFNQREYCEAHGLPLKRFGNWRAKFRHEVSPPARKLLYRRGGGLKHMSKHMRKEIPEPAGYVPSGLLKDTGRRRNFSTADKRRIVEEACRDGASISGVARKYGIGKRLLFHWKQEFEPELSREPILLPVTVTDAAGDVPGCLPDLQAMIAQDIPAAGPVIVERSTPGIEVELVGGRRVRFERDTDPETVRRLVALLEGDGL
ncbi:MAG: transposase [Gammaproteobacteria bacterium]